MVFENNTSKTEFLFQKNGIEVYIKREDLLHKYVSGNKFRKLKYNILAAKNQNINTILTFGGAYSNHITATAYAGKMFDIKTIGIIRGDELGKDLVHTLKTNSSLNFASKNKMLFKFISRTQYRDKTNPTFITALKKEFGDFYLIPEGGSNALAIKGCEEILTKDDGKFDYICTAVGTGGTITGLINTSLKHQTVYGFPALKGDFLTNEIQKNCKNNTNWKLINDYHFGGYAKINDELVRFINQFKTEYAISLDPIYTGKMLFGLHDLITKNHFKKGTKIVCIHTGGLQGIKAMNLKLHKKGLQQFI